jgi:hypothetical protein
MFMHIASGTRRNNIWCRVRTTSSQWCNVVRAQSVFFESAQSTRRWAIDTTMPVSRLNLLPLFLAQVIDGSLSYTGTPDSTPQRVLFKMGKAIRSPALLITRIKQALSRIDSQLTPKRVLLLLRKESQAVLLIIGAIVSQDMAQMGQPIALVIHRFFLWSLRVTRFLRSNAFQTVGHVVRMVFCRQCVFVAYAILLIVQTAPARVFSWHTTSPQQTLGECPGSLPVEAKETRAVISRYLSTRSIA